MSRLTPHAPSAAVQTLSEAFGKQPRPIVALRPVPKPQEVKTEVPS